MTAAGRQLDLGCLGGESRRVASGRAEAMQPGDADGPWGSQVLLVALAIRMSPDGDRKLRSTGPASARLLAMTGDQQARKRARAPWRMMPELPGDEAKGPEWKEINDQFYWYDRAANRNHTAFLLLKVLTLLLGGAVTVLAALNSSHVLTASLAAATVAAEGIQQLFKLQPVWLDYRSTANALRRLAMSYIMREERYHDPKTRQKNLAEDTQTLLASEAFNWEKLLARPGDSGS